MNSNFNETFLKNAVASFATILAPITALSYLVEAEGAVKGDTVKVPFVQSVSASAAFNYATGYSAASSGNTITAKDVTLNTILFQPFTLTDAEMGRLSEQHIITLASQAGAKLAADVISASLASVITNANFPTSASLTANQLTSSGAIVNLSKQADDANWATTRNLILGSEAYAYLLSNPAVNTAYAYGSATPIQNAVFANVYGWTPYKVTSPLPNACKGLVLNPNAILVGIAPHKPAQTAKNVDYVAIQDNQSKLTLGIRTWYDPDKASTNFVLECLTGATVGDPTALFQMK